MSLFDALDGPPNCDWEYQTHPKTDMTVAISLIIFGATPRTFRFRSMIIVTFNPRFVTIPAKSLCLSLFDSVVVAIFSGMERKAPTTLSFSDRWSSKRRLAQVLLKWAVYIEGATIR